MWVESEFFPCQIITKGNLLENNTICSQSSLPMVMTYNAVLQQRPNLNPGDDTTRRELQLTLFDIPAPRVKVTSEALSWVNGKNIKRRVFSYLFESLLSTYFCTDAQCLSQTLTNTLSLTMIYAIFVLHPYNMYSYQILIFLSKSYLF